MVHSLLVKCSLKSSDQNSALRCQEIPTLDIDAELVLANSPPIEDLDAYLEDIPGEAAYRYGYADASAKASPAKGNRSQEANLQRRLYLKPELRKKDCATVARTRSMYTCEKDVT